MRQTNFEAEMRKYIEAFDSRSRFTTKEYGKARAEIRSFHKNMKPLNGLYNRKYHKWEVAHLNFVHEKNSKLALTLYKYFTKGRRSYKHYKEDSFSRRALMDFTNIFIVITNNYGLMRDLVFSGLDYQARVIFRNTIELTELCFSVLYDEEALKYFRECHTNAKGEVIFKGMKYETLKKTSLKVINYVKAVSQPLPSQFWDEYMSIRQRLYEDTSRHVHSNFMAIVAGAYVPLIDRDIMMMNLGGVVNKRTKKIAREIVLYDALSYMILMILMIDKHKLFFKKFGKSAEYLAVMSQANWGLAAHAA